jgi:hypothetical protein
MKNILDKINKADEIQAKKTELAKHEVELSSIAQLENAIKEGKKEIALFDKVENDRKIILEELSKKQKDLLNRIQDFSLNVNQKMEYLFRTFQDLDKKAKELGLSVKENPAYKEAEIVYNKLNTIKGDVAVMKKELGSKF